MNWDAISAVGEVVGAIAVVVTLLYLALQVRMSRAATEENTKATRAASAALSQDSLANFNELIATNPDLSKLITGAISQGSLEGFAPDELFRLQIALRANLQRFESMYFRYEEGLLELRVWGIRRRWLASFISTPPISDWWSAERESSVFSEEFISDIETTDGFVMNSFAQRTPSK
jgi:hypothetical protein